jgi:acylpyruvate hydrolase
LFLKSTSSLIKEGECIELPKDCDVHHEVELAVIIGSSGRDISSKDAMNFVAGYALALDLTARDLQKEAQSTGSCWSITKSYDTFCPIRLVN